jgi:hypothetical protein
MAFQTIALPTELYYHLVGREGLEPPTVRTGLIYSQLAYPICIPAHLVELAGIEPASDYLQGSRVA